MKAGKLALQFAKGDHMSIPEKFYSGLWLHYQAILKEYVIDREPLLQCAKE